MEKYKIIIADDHQIIRQGLKRILEKENWIEVISETDNGREILKLAEKQQPDLIIMDIGMPELNGIEATRQIHERYPWIKILALSIHGEFHFIEDMLEAGAGGYLLKDCAVDELTTAISKMKGGKKYIAKSLANTFLHKYKGNLSDIFIEAEPLTKRENEILQLLAEGNSTKEIADKLYLSPKTVEAHRKNLMEKLDLHTLQDLTKYAIKNGIIHLT
ncbi:MAG: response regulator transcription factor [Prolixibacteraceae bacterium]|nr:response regulator transcription factor [Prolixibacteraceae bacterium]